MTSEKYMINYDLFRMRKMFNPLTLFYRNKNLTYKEFKSYLNRLNVKSPGEAYYLRVKKRFDEENSNVVVASTKPENQSSMSENTEVIVQALEETQQKQPAESSKETLEDKEVTKTKQTRKRKKAKKNED